eukprot:maker-scaffold629_size122686-snap-gene-0.24 protein:Tk00804 transcript:maker-scaffold629_size122686-snap-gene-0.24-mRNA-1 annotation:"transmembrane emp24 domain-containing protein 5"
MNLSHLVVFLLIPLWVACEEASVEVVFDPNQGAQGYQRRYNIDVPHRTEECFFIENVREKQILNFHFMVTNTDKNGKPLDISAKVKSPAGKIVTFQHRKTEAKVIAHETLTNGDYEVCFNNKYSLTESKRVFWQFEVEGLEDEVRDEEKAIQGVLSEYEDTAKDTKKRISMVRTKVSRIKHNQWRHETLMKKDINRAEAIGDMINRWSIIHIVVVLTVGIMQVVVLRRFFTINKAPQKLKARA